MSSNLNKELPAPVLQFLGSCGKYGSLSESAQKLLQGINPAIDAKQIDEVMSTVILHKPEEQSSKFRKTEHLHPQRKRAQYTPSRRKISGQLKRKLGHCIVKRKGKEYCNFLPDHERWLQYCKTFLNFDHYFSKGWVGEPHDPSTITIQNNLKKIEYYGSKLEIVKSRSPSHVGIKGIVIRETKGTFVFICEDNRVKVIPKLQCEFKLNVGRVNFYILGKHLHQRPVERSKHAYKKHELWL